MNGKFAVHALASGLTQHEGRFHGLLKLEEKMLAQGIGVGPNSRVIYKTWHSSAATLAEHVWLLEQHYGATAMVAAYGYSLGGWWVTTFARELDLRGIDLQCAVFCDAVKRRRGLLLPLALLPRTWRTSELEVPENVLTYCELYQSTNVPAGHRLTGPPELTVEDHLERRQSVDYLEVVHEKMDDHPKFHERAIAVARRIESLCEEEV